MVEDHRGEVEVNGAEEEELEVSALLFLSDLPDRGKHGSVRLLEGKSRARCVY